MNSDARRIQSQFNSQRDFDLHQYFAPGQLRDGPINPGIVVTILLVVVAVVYQTAHQQGRVPSLPQFLWDALVSLIPARLLYAIDRLVNPPLFPVPMLKTQSSTHAAKSDVLRRILGVDRTGGFIRSVSQAGRKGFNSLSNATLGVKAAAERPPGLGNYDNSCYQNSILQGLASLKSLPAYLNTPSFERGPDLSPAKTVDTLRKLIDDLGGTSSNGRTLWTPGVLKNMDTWQQQDAQEYYSKLLDEIDKEIAKIARALGTAAGFERDWIRDDCSDSQHSGDSGYQSAASQSRTPPELRLARNPLEGLIAQRVACVACGHCDGLTMIPFNCLTLNLGNLPEHDLYERLDCYTKVESIQGVECLKCTVLNMYKGLRTLVDRTGGFPELNDRLQRLEEALEEDAFDDETLTKKCNIPKKQRVNSTKTKQTVVARAPQSLVFHMNRSVFDERTGAMFKNSAAVRFPMLLDLGPWCLGSAADRSKSGTRPAVATKYEEQWSLDPESSMVAANRLPSRITGPIYELRAVVTHYGRHENGHYVCYRKHSVPTPPAAKDGSGRAEKPPKLASEDDVGAGGPSLDSDGEPLDLQPGEQQLDCNDPEGEQQSEWWWRLSDQDVTKVDERTVLGQGGVFMLFYDRVDPVSLPVMEWSESVNLSPASTLTDGRDTDEGTIRDIASTNSDVTIKLGGTSPVGDVLSQAVGVPLPDDSDGE
ncbi:Ubiquitin carboxyl-terminal hydrolase 1 [Madurella mycetomatis]|uniref:ubiquitinyl hydrolase 1 n=1 Tax=Madurella mycetomatis TaxID=100816 RepID=A0A175WD91_9PEZI|nr:Ubiquitin carboxyl-terminal hydrolase 1 [Madurella mycetomatis]